jgi:hypothetical protein
MDVSNRQEALDALTDWGYTPEEAEEILGPSREERLASPHILSGIGADLMNGHTVIAGIHTDNPLVLKPVRRK